MGVEVRVEGLTKSFGKQLIWQDVTLTLPPGEISVLLGPSGTGKSVFLKSLVGLIRPDRGRIIVGDVDLVGCSERELYELRRLYGVLFQDGALFGSMTLYDNIAFPLREHTKRSERQIREVVTSTMALVGLEGAEGKLPGEISGGMRKRAGLARALVLEPQIVLFDEPDSGLDPVRTAYLNQLIVDLNARTDATFLIVTHDIGTARSVPDNLGLLFRRELVMFGPRELLLTSTEPVVEQFLNGRREGPIGMAEEKDAAQVQEELARLGGGGAAGTGASQPPAPAALPPQLAPTAGLPERRAVARRLDRVRRSLPALPPDAQAAVRASLAAAGPDPSGSGTDGPGPGATRPGRPRPLPPDHRPRPAADLRPEPTPADRPGPAQRPATERPVPGERPGPGQWPAADDGPAARELTDVAPAGPAARFPGDPPGDPGGRPQW
ncbi:MAG TPA: ATP-binding cassette domain-containing protein [Mycobacteriales bacterium]|nr:ATP-binding cassette domain-containing protein [Mycobacteriales bacterium]